MVLHNKESPNLSDVQHVLISCSHHRQTVINGRVTAAQPCSLSSVGQRPRLKVVTI